jgi:hypothetical protein
MFGTFGYNWQFPENMWSRYIIDAISIFIAYFRVPTFASADIYIIFQNNYNIVDSALG